MTDVAEREAAEYADIASPGPVLCLEDALSERELAQYDHGIKELCYIFNRCTWGPRIPVEVRSPSWLIEFHERSERSKGRIVPQPMTFRKVPWVAGEHFEGVVRSGGVR